MNRDQLCLLADPQATTADVPSLTPAPHRTPLGTAAVRVFASRSLSQVAACALMSQLQGRKLSSSLSAVDPLI